MDLSIFGGTVFPGQCRYEIKQKLGKSKANLGRPSYVDLKNNSKPG